MLFDYIRSDVLTNEKIVRLTELTEMKKKKKEERKFIHNKNVAASRLNCVIIYKK